MKVIYGSMAAVLLWAALEDIRKQQLTRVVVLLLGILGVAGILIGKEQDIWSIVCGAAIGIGTMGISMMSDGQIGIGDGMVLTALGLLLGGRQTLILLCIASCLMALVSIVLLIMRKGNRHTRLPFVPAIWGGYLAVMLL